MDEDDESDEEIGEWSKRLKQIKFQAKLEKNKSLPGGRINESTFFFQIIGYFRVAFQYTSKLFNCRHFYLLHLQLLNR